MGTRTQKERLTTEQTDNTETFPDETGAMMWVTDGLGKRRISQTNGGTGRHHWRWAGLVPVAEYEDANATWWPTTKVKANYPGLAEKGKSGTDYEIEVLSKKWTCCKYGRIDHGWPRRRPIS